MKRAVIILFVLCLLGAVGWRVFRKLTEEQKGNSRGGPRAVAVAAEPVRTETIRDVAEFTGTLLPRYRFVVAPKVPGRLEKLLVNIGDPVKQGDLVAVVESEEYAQQVAQARAELEVVRANQAESRSALDIATREFKRAKELREQKVASESELDAVEARYRAAEAKCQVAQAQIEQKQAALKSTEVRLSYTRICAAWEDGGGPRVIAERFVDEGAMLKANDAIVSVVDLTTVIAVIYVIEQDFPDVRVGQPATVTTDAYEDRQFMGKIVRRAPVLKEESRQARVEIEIPNPERLLAPGMFVRAHIEFAEHKNATVVPVTALVRRNGKRGIFLADAKEMKGCFVPVQVGIVNGNSAEVLSPKLEGMVVTLGHHLLEDGAAISLPRAEDTPPSSQPADTPSRGQKKGRP